MERPTHDGDTCDIHAHWGLKMASSGYPRGGPEKKLTKAHVVEALESVGGIMTAAARVLNVHRSTIYRFIQEHPDLKTTRADIEEQTKDMAEGQILTAIKNGEMDTVRWYADRKMRERGYGHRSELSGPNGGAIPVEQATIDPSKLSSATLRELRKARVNPDAADAE